MKSLLSIVALCSFSFVSASEQQDSRVPNCSVFRYMFGAPKVSLENLKSAVESRDYCRARAILDANQEKAINVGKRYILSKIFDFGFKSLADDRIITAELAESIKHSPDILSPDKILSCKECLESSPGSALRSSLIGAASVQKMTDLLGIAAITSGGRQLKDVAAWRVGEDIGSNYFAVARDFSKEDKCRAVIEFFEKYGYSPLFRSDALLNLTSGRYHSDPTVSCNVDGYFMFKMSKETEAQEN